MQEFIHLYKNTSFENTILKLYLLHSHLYRGMQKTRIKMRIWSENLDVTRLKQIETELSETSMRNDRSRSTCLRSLRALFNREK